MISGFYYSIWHVFMLKESSKLNSKSKVFYFTFASGLFLTLCYMGFLDPILHGVDKTTFLYFTPIHMVLLWNFAHIISIIQGMSCTCQKNCDS